MLIKEVGWIHYLVFALEAKISVRGMNVKVIYLQLLGLGRIKKIVTK